MLRGPAADAVRRTLNPVASCESLGLAGTTSTTKFVPDDYLWNSSDVRHVSSKGLLDTDGGPNVSEGAAVASVHAPARLGSGTT